MPGQLRVTDAAVDGVCACEGDPVRVIGEVCTHEGPHIHEIKPTSHTPGHICNECSAVNAEGAASIFADVIGQPTQSHTVGFPFWTLPYILRVSKFHSPHMHILQSPYLRPFLSLLGPLSPLFPPKRASNPQPLFNGARRCRQGKSDDVKALSVYIKYVYFYEVTCDMLVLECLVPITRCTLQYFRSLSQHNGRPR